MAWRFGDRDGHRRTHKRGLVLCIRQGAPGRHPLNFEFNWKPIEFDLETCEFDLKPSEFDLKPIEFELKSRELDLQVFEFELKSD